MRNPAVLKVVEASKTLKYFAYYRKSTESDERQVQSLPDQRSWANGFSKERNLSVVEQFEESKSARKVGRPVFDEMLARIEAGEANAILAWAPDRLARNATDGARIIDLLDSGKLRHLGFATYTFENNPNGKFMLGFMFAQSKYYTDSLSEVVLRGMRSKAQKGIFPGWAKYGYYNHPKTKECLPDPVTFPLIIKAYELYATNCYSLKGLSSKLFELGLTNRTGGELCKRQIVDILTDPFYYGAFVWSRELFEGIHTPAVSKQLWDKVQQVYASRSKPQSKWTKELVFRGLFRCPECGGAITGESHTKHQMNGNVHTWRYYRCTKKGGATKCSQPAVREEVLVEQCRQRFMEIALPDGWVIPMLEQLDKWELEETSQNAVLSDSLREEARNIEAKLCRLNDLAVEGEIDRAEYRARKQDLVSAKIVLEARRMAFRREGQMYWLEPLRNFVKAVWERNLAQAGGDLLKLRELVAEAGLNLTLNSGKVLWDWLPPYALLAERDTRSNWWAGGDMSSHSKSQPEGLGADVKRAALQRVARGESPDAVARSISVPTQMLMEWVRKYESAKQDAPDSPDEEHLAALRDRPFGHSGLGPSIAEIDYPELLKCVDPKYYESLTEEQQQELIIRQAIAQEKVGYEKYAPKFFLPEDEDPFPESRRAGEADMFVALEINRPLLMLGGVLIGVAMSLAAMKLGANFSGVSWWVLASGAAAAVLLVLVGSR